VLGWKNKSWHFFVEVLWLSRKYTSTNEVNSSYHLHKLFLQSIFDNLHKSSF
jgi:hypothetical protein